MKAWQGLPCKHAPRWRSHSQVCRVWAAACLINVLLEMQTLRDFDMLVRLLILLQEMGTTCSQVS